MADIYRMVEVLFFAPLYPPYEEPGSSVYFESLARELAKDHTVHVVAPYGPSAPLVESTGELTVYRGVLRRDRLPTPVRALLEPVTALLVALFVLVSRPVDVCHAPSTSYSTASFAIAAALTGTPLFYDCRDENFPAWLITTGPTARWFSCAPNIDERLVECGVPEDGIVRVPVVNPPYVDEYARVPGLDAGDDFTIVFVGRLLRKKGVLPLVDAAALLSREVERVALTYVGSGPAEGEVDGRARSLGIEPLVRVTGQVPHRRALEILAGSDVLVHPSSDEGVPRVIVEAFAIGVPVVATPVGGVPELVRDGETGLIVEGDPEDIADALSALQEDPHMAERLATNAREHGRQYTWSTVRERVTDAYRAPPKATRG